MDSEKYVRRFTAPAICPTETRVLVARQRRGALRLNEHDCYGGKMGLEIRYKWQSCGCWKLAEVGRPSAVDGDVASLARRRFRDRDSIPGHWESGSSTENSDASGPARRDKTGMALAHDADVPSETAAHLTRGGQYR